MFYSGCYSACVSTDVCFAGRLAKFGGGATYDVKGIDLAWLVVKTVSRVILGNVDSDCVTCVCCGALCSAVTHILGCAFSCHDCCTCSQIKYNARNADSSNGSVPNSAGKFVMKMDIEGGEFIVLPGMVASGALCHLNVAFIEYHAIGGDVNKLKSQIADVVGSYPRCTVNLLDMDDETYYDAGDEPLPEPLQL
jgi:hypothetical protein